MRSLIAVLALAACGPKHGRPTYDTAKLARRLHTDLEQLGAIAQATRGDCTALVAQLGPHVEAMRAHAAEVKRAQQDPEVATRLRRDVATYDEAHRGIADAIGDDLGGSYRTCPDNKQLLQLIDRIPEL